MAHRSRPGCTSQSSSEASLQEARPHEPTQENGDKVRIEGARPDRRSGGLERSKRMARRQELTGQSPSGGIKPIANALHLTQLVNETPASATTALHPPSPPSSSVGQTLYANGGERG